jgi:hypothetical protein
MTEREIKHWLEARTYALPILSSYNGPSALPHALEKLHTLGVPRANVRFLPVIDYAASPEIVPYQQANTRPNLATLGVRLHVNMRGDNRLCGFLPLVVSGLIIKKEEEENWTNREAPSERLARQLAQQYPELREQRQTEKASPDVLTFRQGIGYVERESVLPMQAETESESATFETTHETATEISEVFLTQCLLYIATIDLIGGFDFVMPTEPKERDIDLRLGPDATIAQISSWLERYPHLQLHHADEEYEPEYIQASLQEMHQAIGYLYQEDAPRTEPLTAAETLSLVRRFLPGYVPHYPRQISVSGGMNKEGILLALMGKWLERGPVLGMREADWQQFSRADQAILCALLLQRRHAYDPVVLFSLALRLLAHPQITIVLEPSTKQAVRLGQPLAQLGRTLFLGGNSDLHAPEVVVQIPLDQTREAESSKIEENVCLLQKLFLPVHLPMRVVWKVNWPYLGKSAYLLHASNPDTQTNNLVASRLPDGA